MIIIDEKGNEILEFDPKKGYLVESERLVKHHEAVEAVEEQGHWETVAIYENGGKDVAWVVDVAGVKAKDAWDEYEPVQKFVAYTEKQLAETEIEELKAKLLNTDYKILKVVEGAITLAEIAETVAQRAAWRAKINELEKVVGG